MAELVIDFVGLDRIKWLKKVADTVQNAVEAQPDDVVLIRFDNIDKVDKILPVHIVSLACLIEYLDKLNWPIGIANDNAVGAYLSRILQFKEYWAGGRNYVSSADASIFNLWRVVDGEKEVHSRRIHDYLKQTFFRNKDLSAVQNSLDEVYYNIFDHANASGNAFSFVKFDERNEKLFVAVCDFGIGIARSVKNVLPEIGNDAAALQKALEYKFTTGSQMHNKGMGLGNIKDTCTEDDILGIISNSGSLFAKRDNIRTYINDFDFPGTLIYYELSLSHFDDEEIFDNFAL